jgi:AraC-like DNA-binding protein
MDALLSGAIGFGLSQILLGLILLWRVPGWGLVQRLYGLLLLAILGYVLKPLVSSGPLNLLFSTVQTAVPGMFWLFSASLFDDHFQLRKWQVGLVAYTVALPLLGWLLAIQDIRLQWFFFDIPQAVEFLLLGLMLWAVAQNWRSDLVETRRRLRFWFVGLNGSYLFVLILSREVLFPDQAWLASGQYVTEALLLLAINATLMQYRNGALFDSTADIGSRPVAASIGEVDPELLVALKTHVESTHAWREMGLTIGQLAAKLDVPQYRLRQAINSQLGYRNFNDFLNSYRIGEASERLVNPLSAQLPVLTIAMDAGFRSLSSFNTAFRNTHGTTPTAYRRSGQEHRGG